jgi:hypothetical protein
MALIVLVLTQNSAHNGQNRDAESLRVWVYYFIPSAVKELEKEDSYKKAIKSKEVWLIDYYAPWCSHCTYFGPEFEIIAKVCPFIVWFF